MGGMVTAIAVGASVLMDTCQDHRGPIPRQARRLLA